jgi:hypothetical protein
MPKQEKQTWKMTADDKRLGEYNVTGEFPGGVKRWPKQMITGEPFSRVGGGFSIRKTVNMSKRYFYCFRSAFTLDVEVIEPPKKTEPPKKAAK